eukprot:8201107-Alexandrium_andersonii.AAC.1
MSAYYTIALYRGDAVVYQGNDWYAVGEVIRLGDTIKMPRGVDVSYMGGYDDNDGAHVSDETSVGSRTEDYEVDEDDDEW